MLKPACALPPKIGLGPFKTGVQDTPNTTEVSKKDAEARNAGFPRRPAHQISAWPGASCPPGGGRTLRAPSPTPRAAMKKLCSLALLLAAHCAHAEWTVLGEQNGATFYMDMQSATGGPDARQVWEMLNMPQPDAEGVHSVRFQMEYDCEGKRSRGLNMLAFAEPMSAGTEMASLGEDPEGWEDIEAGTIYDLRLRAACAK